MSDATWRGMDVGDLVVSARGHWHMPKIIVKKHATAGALVGVLFDGDVKWIHYKHLEVVSRYYKKS